MQATQFGALRSPIVDKDGMPTRDFLQWLIQQEQKTRQTLTQLGQIKDTAPIVGRTEGVGTTVGNIDASGIVKAAGADFSRAYVNKNTDNITDATGSPLAGGKRGFVALDTNNRLASGINNNPLNVSSAPTSTTAMTNDGISTTVNVPAFTQQFDFGTVSYGLTSFDPGSFGTWFAWIDDPTFAGGTIAPQFSSTPPSQTANKGRIPLGKIISVGGAAKTGGGYSGGSTPGGSGGRGYSPA